MIALLNIIDEI